VEEILTHVAPIIVLGVPIVVFFVLKKKKKKKRKKEKATNEFISNVASRTAGLNTKYIEEGLFQTVKMLVSSFYSQNPNNLPFQSMSSELYSEWYEKMRREYEVGITKRLVSFDVFKIRVAKQKKMAINFVSSIEVEAYFDIEYDYFHSTAAKRISKKYKQRFVFTNNNQSWCLNKVLQEEML